MSLQTPSLQMLPEATPSYRVPLHYSPYRLFAMIPASALVTLALMYLMHRLVFIEAVVVEEPPTKSIAPFFMEVEEIETVRETPPQKPVEQDPPPMITDITPEIPDLHDDDTASIGYYGGGATHRPALNVGAGGSLIRQVGVPPQYPRGMLARDVEGFVDLQFDVTAYGATTNIRVLQSVPEGAFDRAAIKAVQRWKYKPRYIEGEAVASYNIRERIRFTIEK